MWNCRRPASADRCGPTAAQPVAVDIRGTERMILLIQPTSGAEDCFLRTSRTASVPLLQSPPRPADCRKRTNGENDARPIFFNYVNLKNAATPVAGELLFRP